MGNYELKSEVSQLESQFRQIENENNKLRSEIANTVNSVNQAEHELSNYNQHIRNTLDNATNTVNSSINTALNAYELQGQIDKLYTRYKSVELANKRIRALNNKKYYDFNNYRTVRKIVQGMMDNLDLNMISDAVIYKSIERQHLQTPDFWLTCVLISIMAWKSDDALLAEKALEKAVKLDKKTSSIFYMIFNIRMERNIAAIKWFMLYQQCDLKGSDENTFLMLFSLISKTLTSNVDAETSSSVKEFINNIILKSAEREGYSEEDIILLIHKYIMNMMKIRIFDLPLMAKYCINYSMILNILNLAGNNYNILEFILKIVNIPISEKNTYLKEYLNELLRKPNDAEKETYDEIEYNELIIRYGGDIDTAKAEFTESKNRREAELDIISSIIRWVYDDYDKDVNGQMRLNMFSLVKAFQEKAVERYYEVYHSMFTNILPVKIQDYSSSIDFTEQSREVEKIENYYNEQQKTELSTIRNWKAYLLFGAGAVSIVAAFFTSLLLLGVGGICGVFGIGVLLGNKRNAKNIILDIQGKKHNTLEILQKMFMEFEEFKSIYKELDDISHKIKIEFDEI